MVQGMQASFQSFALGLILALVLLYLILVAQFRSFIDPLLILLAVPTGLTGVLLALFLTGTTLNVQSLMGVLMMVGMVVSNSILIVEFTHRLEEDGMPLARRGRQLVPHPPAADSDDVARDGLRPDADGAEARHRQRGVRAAGARDHRRPAWCRSLLTVFIVPAAYLMVYRRQRRRSTRRWRSDPIVASVVVLATCSSARRRRCLRRAAAALSLQDAEAARAAEPSADSRRRSSRPQAAREVVREARSAYFPTVFGSVTGAEAAGRQPHRGRRAEQPDHLRSLRRRRHRRRSSSPTSAARAISSQSSSLTRRRASRAC